MEVYVSNSVQDRTFEFQQAVKTFARQNNTQLVNNNTNNNNNNVPSKNEFNRKAGMIAKHIVRVTGSLTKLAHLAKKKQLFGDKPTDIIELTYVIKQDIFKIEKELKDLKTLQISNNKSSSDDNQLKMYNSNVVQLLNTKTKNISENFKEVLMERQKSELIQRSRQEQLLAAVKSTTAENGGLPYAVRSANLNSGGGGTTGSLASDNPFLASLGIDESSADNNNNNNNNNNQITNLSNEGGYDDNTMLSLPDQTQQLMLLEEQDNRYVQERSQAVDAIESTINEVGGLFQQLATMVQEQGEVIQRIDDNIEDVSLNIGGAQRELMKYYKSVSSNRWLMLKVFGILIVFFLLWVLVS